MKKQAPDAIDLLDADHLALHALFRSWGELVRTHAPALQRRALAEEICMALTIHARLEEELFYPAVREALHDDALADDAHDAHGSQRELVRQILATPPEDARCTTPAWRRSPNTCNNMCAKSASRCSTAPWPRRWTCRPSAAPSRCARRNCAP